MRKPAGKRGIGLPQLVRVCRKHASHLVGTVRDRPARDFSSRAAEPYLLLGGERWPTADYRVVHCYCNGRISIEKMRVTHITRWLLRVRSRLLREKAEQCLGTQQKVRGDAEKSRPLASKREGIAYSLNV